MRLHSIVYLIAFAIALGVCPLFAQDPSNVAVTLFTGDKTVSTEQLEFITAKFSGELIASNAFKVLDRGKMDFILQEQGFQQSGACNSSECKVQMGQLLGVDNLVAGKLVRFGSVYAMHLEYIDVASGEIAKTVDVEKKGDLEDVYKSLCQNAASQLVLAVQVEKEAPKLVGTVPEVPADAIPRADSKPLSGKRKVALALWSASLAGAGGGYYFNSQGNDYASDYEAAIASQNVAETQASYDNTQAADRNRNIGYGVSVGSLVIGAVLWFWPEEK